MAELTWDQWKIAPHPPGAEVLGLSIQGNPLHDILSLIRQEIEKLRRSDSKAAIAALSNRIEEDKERNRSDMARVNDRIDKLRHKIDEGGQSDIIEEKLKKAMDRITQLEQQVAMNQSSGVKDAVTELQTRVALLEDKIRYMEDNYVKVADFKKSDIPDDLVERVERVEKNEQGIMDRQHNLAERVRQCEDSTFSLSSHQGKMIGDIAKLATSIEATQRNLDNIENLTDRHTEDIKDLFSNKADISEMHRLAGVAGGATGGTPRGGGAAAAAAMGAGGGGPVVRFGGGAGASREDVNKLHDLIAELDHQLKMLSAATTEGFNGVQKKTDKKIEFMTNWIVKYLRNLLRDGGNIGGDKETDIGKVQMAVKCLVCNQPARQNESDGINPPPSFKNTFGVRKERRLRQDSHGNRVDNGIRSPINDPEDPRAPRRTPSPPHDRPKSAGINRTGPPPRVPNITDEDPAQSELLPRVLDDPRSQSMNIADDAPKRSSFSQEMEK
jgi:hypothetical protein